MTDLAQLAVSEAIRQGVDPHLILRQMGAESGGDSSAVSPKGARGAMQLMPATARELGVDPNNPADNVRGGVAYMKQQLDRFGTPELAAAAYNAGPGAVQRARGVPNFPETQSYVRKVAGKSSTDGGFDQDVFSTSAPAIDGGLDPDVFGAAITGESRTIPSPSNPGHTALEITPVAAHKDQGLGFLKGVLKPWDNAAMALENVVGRMGVDTSALNASVGAPSAVDTTDQHQAFIDRQAARGRVPGGIGEFAGNVAGTIPVMFGNPIAGGAAAGALLTDKRDPLGIATDAGVGAIAGKVGDTLLKGARAVVAPAVSRYAGDLIKRGVQVPYGDIFGGGVRKLEDKMTSLPFIGDAIETARNRGMDQFNRAAIDDVLAPIKQKLPGNIDTGHQAIEYAGKTVSDAYGKLLPTLNIQADKTLATNLASLKGLAANLEPNQAQLFNKWMAKTGSKFSGVGKMSGDTFKELDSEMGKEYSLYRGSPAPADQKYAQAILQLQAELRGMVERANPAKAKELQAINQSFAMLRRAEGAAAQGLEGKFSGAQLRTASRQQDSSLYKRATARGKGLMQDLGTAGQKTFGNRVPDSGSAGRLNLTSIPAWVAGAATIPLRGAYSPTTLARVGPLLTSRPAQAHAIADLLALLKGPAVTGSSAAAVRARQNGPKP